jgi:parvulin-like peptidyl-prolyl isomerase
MSWKNMLRAAAAVSLLAALAVGASGCGNQDVAAIVNGDAITMTELNQQLEQLEQQYPNMFEGAEGEARLLEFKQRLLDNLIDQKLVLQAAEERGIEITDEDVQGQIDQLKQGFETDEEWEEALTNAGMNPDTLEDQIREQLLTQKLIESLSDDVEITEVEITEYYEGNKQMFFEDAAKRSSHILFKPEDKAKAEEVLAELEDGEDFAALAKEYSQDPGSAQNGGDLGWPTTPFVPEFEEAVSGLDKGEMSGLVETQFGWHIIVVTDTREGKQQTQEEAKEQIEQVLRQQKRADAYQSFLDDLRAAAEIEIVAEELKAEQLPTVPLPDEAAPEAPAPEEEPAP